MKVVVASLTRFHVAELARQLHAHGVLARYYIGYPTRISGLPPDKICSFPVGVLLAKVAQRFCPSSVYRLINWWVIETFDAWVSRRLEQADVFVALSSFGLRSMEKAKAFGARVVCDRGSTHIVYQDQLLAAEYARHGLVYQPIDPRVVRKELREYAEADLITVPSSFAYQSFIDQGIPACKVARLPYGVDLESFRPIPKRDDTFRAIYVGRISIQKGIPDLLEALATVNLPDYELLLIGPVEREAKPFLARYAGGYRHIGTVPRDKLYRWYSQASVFTMASVQEGLALVLAQAMACGLPIVATTNTGAEDLITDGVEGFIVPIRSPEILRERVLFLYHHPEVRREMAQAALQRVQQLGGWDSYGRDAIALYRSLVAP